MPLFTYSCKKCKTESEILVRGDAAPVCPKCGSKVIVKQTSAISPRMGRGSAPEPGGCGSCASRGSCPNSFS